MNSISRREALATSLFAAPGLASSIVSLANAETGKTLPMSTIFKGDWKFKTIVKKAVDNNWREKPIHERMILFARELDGTKYMNFTLEIDDYIESPSVNLWGLDCWTFFETTLGLARMIAKPTSENLYQPEDLLDEIRWTRYRGGKCTGNYLERIHYLAEWYFENDARGNISNITRELGCAEKIEGRKITEMTALWKYYRYLKMNPSLRAPMKTWEDYVAALPVYYIPKNKVADIEPQLQDGDIIGIVTKYDGGFCSHVGLTIRTQDKVTRFMHASRTYRKVLIDQSISGYLHSIRKHAGIIVGRPLEITETTSDEKAYKDNLEKLIAAI